MSGFYLTERQTSALKESNMTASITGGTFCDVPMRSIANYGETKNGQELSALAMTAFTEICAVSLSGIPANLTIFDIRES